MPGIPVTQGLEGPCAKAAVDFCCPGFGSDRHSALSPPCTPQEKAALGGLQHQQNCLRRTWISSPKKEGAKRAGRSPSSRTLARLHRSIRTAPCVSTSTQPPSPRLTRLGHTIAALLLSSLPPPSPVFTLCFSAFCLETLPQTQAKPGEDCCLKAARWRMLVLPKPFLASVKSERTRRHNGRRKGGLRDNPRRPETFCWPQGP